MDKEELERHLILGDLRAAVLFSGEPGTSRLVVPLASLARGRPEA
jgi:hypothetical protein